VLLLIYCIAAQNEVALKNLFYGQLLNNLVPLVIRFVFRLLGYPFSTTALILSVLSLVLSQFIYGRLTKMGSPKRDAAGAVISPGEDLSRPGITEWMFDILYITCKFRIYAAFFYWLM
jgi:hypothetical protein